MLDAIEVGVVVIGEDAKVKSISGVAQKMMEHQAAIAISSSEGLRLLDETAQAVLTSMLVWPYVGPKESSFFFDGKKLTMVSVTKDHIASYFEGSTVLLLMEEPKEVTFDPAPFTLAFGLTKAETRALEAIVGGKSTDQLAKETRRSRETIRAQIKSLFAKTQTHSRENVLRLVQCDPLFRTSMHSRKDEN